MLFFAVNDLRSFALFADKTSVILWQALELSPTCCGEDPKQLPYLRL